MLMPHEAVEGVWFWFNIEEFELFYIRIMILHRKMSNKSAGIFHPDHLFQSLSVPRCPDVLQSLTWPNEGHQLVSTRWHLRGVTPTRRGIASPFPKYFTEEERKGHTEHHRWQTHWVSNKCACRLAAKVATSKIREPLWVAQSIRTSERPGCIMTHRNGGWLNNISHLWRNKAGMSCNCVFFCYFRIFFKD